MLFRRFLIVLPFILILVYILYSIWFIKTDRGDKND